MRNIDIMNLSTEALKVMRQVLTLDLLEAEKRAEKLKESLLTVFIELEARGENDSAITKDE